MILDEKELVRWGRLVGEAIQTPIFIGLRGPLGAGKSVLARAIATGAGVSETMPSPTFNILLRYETDEGIEIAHADLYRIDGPGELPEIGWEDFGKPNEIVLVEWPERAGDLLPEDRWEIDIGPAEAGPRFREVGVSRIGDPAHIPGFPMAVSRREERRRRR